jgi:hypothetical protein
MSHLGRLLHLAAVPLTEAPMARQLSPREGVSVHAPSIDPAALEERGKGTEWIVPNGTIYTWASPHWVPA